MEVGCFYLFLYTKILKDLRALKPEGCLLSFNWEDGVSSEGEYYIENVPRGTFYYSQDLV